VPRPTGRRGTHRFGGGTINASGDQKSRPDRRHFARRRRPDLKVRPHWPRRVDRARPPQSCARVFGAEGASALAAARRSSAATAELCPVFGAEGSSATRRPAKAEAPTAGTVTWGFRGLGPLSRYARGPGSRFPRTQTPAHSLPRLDSNQ
jgi:hypothetical protein